MRIAAAACALWYFAALPAGGAAAAPAHDCTGQNAVCVATCVQYGIGRSRKQDPHPMGSEFCQRHCAAWYASCRTSGCWNGDLVRLCGLDKK